MKVFNHVTENDLSFFSELLPYHEVFGIEGQVVVGFFLDVLVGFVTYHELAEGATRIGKVQVETVLVTV